MAKDPDAEGQNAEDEEREGKGRDDETQLEPDRGTGR
jgi:hypothetical protein